MVTQYKIITEMRLCPNHVLVFYSDKTCATKPYKPDGSVDLFPNDDPEYWSEVM
jgi:hypothetical protein